MSATNNLYNVKYSIIRPKYFAPFYNFGSLLLNTYEEGFLSSKQKVTDTVTAIEKKLMGDRKIINGFESDERFLEVEQLFQQYISCRSLADGREIAIVSDFLEDGALCDVCIKSNRTSVMNLTVQGTFRINLGSRALPYDNEKYSVGVISKSGKSGFALVVEEGEAAVKGSMYMKVIYFNESEYISDLASKYTDVEPFMQ